jgi:ferredoxin
MPKPRILQKYEVDESRCILCGICVDACPYDALRDGADIELAHTSRENPAFDLIAVAAIDHETEVTYIRRERDWAARAAAAGRGVDTTRMLPVLPASVTGVAAGVIAVLIALAVTATDWGAVSERVRLSTAAMSKALFADFVFPFEIVSVLLLAAVVGAIFLAKREPGGPS